MGTRLPFYWRKRLKNMKVIFFLLAVAIALWLAFGNVWAGDAALTWTNPTGNEQCTNSSTPLVRGGTRIYQMVAEVPAAATSYTVAGLLPGSYRFTATTFDDAGVESRTAGATTKTIDKMLLTQTSVYTVVRVSDAFVLLPVGNAPVGTECNANVTVNGHYGVPVASVAWSGNIRATVVVGKCS